MPQPVDALHAPDLPLGLRGVGLQVAGEVRAVLPALQFRRQDDGQGLADGIAWGPPEEILSG